MVLNEIYDPPQFDFVDIGLRRVPDGLIEEYGINMDPEYQRGHVWTVEQRQKYVGYILTGGTTLPVIVNMPKGYGYREAEIVDGKQRLTSICMWLDGEFDAELYDGRTVSAEELLSDPTSHTMMSTSVRIKVAIVQLDRKGVLDYYLRFNNGGTVHSEEEIQRVRQLLEDA